MNLIYLIVSFAVVCHGAPLEETFGEEKNDRQLLGDILSEMKDHHETDTNLNTGFDSEFENSQPLANIPPFINTEQDKNHFDDEIGVADVDQDGNVAEDDFNSEDVGKPAVIEGLQNFDGNNFDNAVDGAIESQNPGLEADGSILENEVKENQNTISAEDDHREWDFEHPVADVTHLDTTGNQAEQIPEHWDVSASNDDDDNMKDIKEESNEIFDHDLSEDNDQQNEIENVAGQVDAPNSDDDKGNVEGDPTNPPIVEAGESYKEKLESDTLPFMSSPKEDNPQEAEDVKQIEDGKEENADETNPGIVDQVEVDESNEEDNNVDEDDVNQDANALTDDEMNEEITAEDEAKEVGENQAAEDNSLFEESNNAVDEKEMSDDNQDSNVMDDNDVNGDINEQDEVGQVGVNNNIAEEEEISEENQDADGDRNTQDEVEANPEDDVNPITEEPNDNVVEDGGFSNDDKDVNALNDNEDIDENIQVETNLAAGDVIDDEEIKEDYKPDASPDDNIPQQESNPLSVDEKEDAILKEEYHADGKALVEHETNQIEAQEPYQGDGMQIEESNTKEVVVQVENSDSINQPQTILAESVEQTYVEQNFHQDEDKSEEYQQAPANSAYEGQQFQNMEPKSPTHFGENPALGNFGEDGFDGNIDEPHSPVMSDGGNSEYHYDLGNDDLAENDFDTKNAQKFTIVNTENGREGEYEQEIQHSDINENEREQSPFEDENVVDAHENDYYYNGIKIKQQESYNNEAEVEEYAERKWENEEEKEDDYDEMTTTMANEINEPYGTRADEGIYDDDMDSEEEDDFALERQNGKYDDGMIEEIEEETKQSSFFSFLLLSTVIVLTIFLCVRSPALFYSFFLCCKTGKVAQLFPATPKQQGYSILPMGDKSV